MTIKEKINDTIRDVEDFPKKGIVFKDITPILDDPSLSEEIVDEFYLSLPKGVTHIAGIESRGFLFGFPAAMKNKSGFVLIRKKGKLPYKTVSVTYDLEYGTAEIEMHIDALKTGDRVIIHDDLLATGGTAVAAAKLIQSQGAEILGFSFVVELAFLEGRKRLEEFTSNITSIVKY